MLGPIDFIIVGFDGQEFDGSILRELRKALDNQIVALIGLSIIAKDEQGKVTSINVADTGDDYITEIIRQYPPKVEQTDAADILEAADLLTNNSVCALLVVEHLWAIPLKKAIAQRGGVLLADGRIHPDAALEMEGVQHAGVA